MKAMSFPPSFFMQFHFSKVNLHKKFSKKLCNFTF